jgi:hypothetical protein
LLQHFFKSDVATIDEQSLLLACLISTLLLDYLLTQGQCSQLLRQTLDAAAQWAMKADSFIARDHIPATSPLASYPPFNTGNPDDPCPNPSFARRFLFYGRAMNAREDD